MKKTKPTKQWKYVMLFLPMAVPVKGHLWNTSQYRFILPTNLSMILIYLHVIKSLNNNGTVCIKVSTMRTIGLTLITPSPLVFLLRQYMVVTIENARIPTGRLGQEIDEH